MKKYLFPLLPAIVFIFMQLGAAIVLAIITIISNLDMHQSFNCVEFVSSSVATAALLLSSVLTVAVISLMKMINWKTVFKPTGMRWSTSITYVVAAILGIFACDILEEMLNLPNLIEAEMDGMVKTTLGMLTIGVIGPICEEFTFREAMMGSMLRSDVKPWTAIIISAIAFGLIHMNPAQIPFATLIGIVFGYIYYRTGNLILPCLLHILNNSVAVAMMVRYGEAANDMSLVEMLGGTPTAVAVMLLCAAACIYLFRLKR